MNALLNFYNAFDDVTISLDDESPEGKGPFTVTVSHGDDSMNPGEVSETKYTDLAAAKKEFIDHVTCEMNAVL